MADAVAMPGVRELADDILIAMDDLRALPRPGDHDHPDTPASVGVVARASRAVTATVSRTVTGAVGGVVTRVARQVATTAMDAAVSQVTRRSKPTTKSGTRLPRASASNKGPGAG